MSSAASPNPNNMMMLAVIGIGAYWLMTRRAVARPVNAPASAASAGNALASVVNALGGLFGKTAASAAQPYPYYGTYDGRAAQPWDTTPADSGGAEYNNPSAYVAPGSDNVAYNPVGSTPWDAQNSAGYLG